VSSDDIADQLGHRMPNRTTGRYVHASVEKFARVRAALDDIANDIGRLAGRPMDISSLRASCVLGTRLSVITPAAKSLTLGAGEGIRTS